MTQAPIDKRYLEMLPFYVNGTLDAAEKNAFEAELSRSEALRIEVEKEHDLQEALSSAMNKELDQTNDPDPAKIQALTGAPVSSQSNGSLSSALSFLNPVNWKPAITFALAAAAVGQAAIIAGQSDTISNQDVRIAQLEDDNFALANGGTDCDKEATLALELTGDTQWSAITDLLIDEKLVVTRVTSGGILMLRSAEDDTDLDALIERLGTSTLVQNISRTG